MAAQPQPSSEPPELEPGPAPDAPDDAPLDELDDDAPDDAPLEELDDDPPDDAPEDDALDDVPPSGGSAPGIGGRGPPPSAGSWIEASGPVVPA